MAARIAVEYDVPYETLDNLVSSESSWNPLADNGHDRGLVQINRATRIDFDERMPLVTDEQALDPEFALRFAAKAIKEGKESRWVACNCYLLTLARTGIGSVTQKTAPRKGVVAVMDYDGIPHRAEVLETQFDGFLGFESNYEPCKIGKRFIRWDDPHLKYFIEKSPDIVVD